MTKIREIHVAKKNGKGVRMSIRFPEDRYPNAPELESVMSAYLFEDDDVDLYYDDTELPTRDANGKKIKISRSHPKDGKVPRHFKKFGTMLKGCDVHGNPKAVVEG